MLRRFFFCFFFGFAHRYSSKFPHHRWPQRWNWWPAMFRDHSGDGFFLGRRQMWLHGAAQYLTVEETTFSGLPFASKYHIPGWLLRFDMIWCFVFLQDWFIDIGSLRVQPGHVPRSPCWFPMLTQVSTSMFHLESLESCKFLSQRFDVQRCFQIKTLGWNSLSYVSWVKKSHQAEPEHCRFEIDISVPNGLSVCTAGRLAPQLTRKSWFEHRIVRWFSRSEFKYTFCPFFIVYKKIFTPDFPPKHVFLVCVCVFSPGFLSTLKPLYHGVEVHRKVGHRSTRFMCLGIRRFFCCSSSGNGWIT